MGQCGAFLQFLVDMVHSGKGGGAHLDHLPPSPGPLDPLPPPLKQRPGGWGGLHSTGMGNNMGMCPLCHWSHVGGGAAIAEKEDPEHTCPSDRPARMALCLGSGCYNNPSSEESNRSGRS